MFGGPGLPFTFHNFLRTFYSHTSQFSTNPGKRIANLISAIAFPVCVIGSPSIAILWRWRIYAAHFKPSFDQHGPLHAEVAEVS